MDRQEIAAQLASMPMTFAGSDDDPEFGIRLSRMINEGYADLIAMHPDRFGAFATLPADGPDEALAELAYALDELRLDGRLFGRPISDALQAAGVRR
jgi:6-methylsalicylate decarboxylase